MDHPTVSWQAMQEGNVFYRRQQCYATPGKLPEIEDYIIAGCRYGGPIGASLSLKPQVFETQEPFSTYAGSYETSGIGSFNPLGH